VLPTAPAFKHRSVTNDGYSKPRGYHSKLLHLNWSQRPSYCNQTKLHAVKRRYNHNRCGSHPPEYVRIAINVLCATVMLRKTQRMRNLDPRQTDCFLAAIQTGTVRAAAAYLGIEPSTVSRNITALEKAVATALLERGRTGVRTTPAGALLLGFLHKQNADLELLQSDLDDLAKMKRGNVAVACGEGFVGALFDSALTEFSCSYPDITFTLTVGSTEHVMHEIASEQAHLGLAYNVLSDPQIRVQARKDQPLAAVVCKGGRFDLAGAFDLNALTKMPCVVPPKSFGIGTLIAQLETRAGIRIRAAIETGSIAAIKGFVRNDMGYAILPRFVVEGEIASGQMACYPLPFDAASNGVASLIRKQGRALPQASQLFMRHLSQMAAFS
jgi:DNA-binding transcriptional LysR family regulator